jgi:hypothetical protein
MNKQPYQKPELVDYGHVEILTQDTEAPKRKSRTDSGDTAFKNV